MLERDTTTHQMHLDPGCALEPDSALLDAAFMRYAFHNMYLLVEGINRKENLVEGFSSTYNMHLAQG